MPEPENNLESRVTVLERQFLQLREQVALSSSEAAAARVLAAGADHDVSEVRAELRAHTQALNALRETQLELSQQVTSLENWIASLDNKITGLDSTVTSLDNKITGLDSTVTSLDNKITQGFATLATGMAQITALLTPNSDSGHSSGLPGS